MTPAEKARLLRAAPLTRAMIRDRLLVFAERYWLGMGSWRDADVTRFANALIPRLEAAQIQTANLTASYMAQLLEDDPAGLILLDQLRGGVPAEEIYRRPAATMRTQLSRGASFPAALAASSSRLRSLITTDMQLANTHQARAAMRGSRTGYFRRVLTGAEDCALCVIASTQRYSKEDLLPIHPGCDCEVAPLAPGLASQQVIDEGLLERTHAEVSSHIGRESDRGARLAGRSTDDGFSEYTDLIITREHGEYGPTLAWRDQNFTSAADL